ncbi:hypothetical protein B0T22DRAFT_441629 [Podospora appendiculata]|uniref:Uncharacterized protein n=1 Tax=Podospora appendiculata TaxID=314037 RepID=A0AAE0XCK8_9PEZI|nr:hypothetical protein B0T22DRAFT_441629 [Podospora appendiculata]
MAFSTFSEHEATPIRDQPFGLSIIQDLLGRRTLAGHIKTCPGLTRRAALLRHIMREIRSYDFQFIYVVPTEREASIAQDYFKQHTDIALYDRDAAVRGLAVESSRALFITLKDNEAAEDLWTKRCLFILECPVVSNSFWPTAAADLLLDWMREKRENSRVSRETVGIVTLSSCGPDQSWSHKVLKAIGELPRRYGWEDSTAPLAPGECVARTHNLDYNPSSSSFDLLMQEVTDLAIKYHDQAQTNRQSGTPPQRLSMVCAADFRDYSEVVKTLQSADQEWGKNIHFTPYISITSTINVVQKSWAKFSAAPEPKIIGVDPAFHFMYPYDDLTDIIIASHGARKLFDQGLAGPVYEPCVRREKSAMDQAEAFASDSVKAHMHYPSPQSDDELPPAEQARECNPSMEEIFLATYFYPRSSLSLRQLQLCTHPSYPRAAEWTRRQLKTIMRSPEQAIGPNAPDQCETRDVKDDDLAGIAKSQAYKGGMWLMVGFLAKHCRHLQDRDYIFLDDEIPGPLEIYIPLFRCFAAVGQLMAEAVGLEGGLLEALKADEDENQDPLTAAEVLEIECHLVRAFVFELIRFVNPAEGRSHCVSTKTPVGWDEMRDFFVDTERVQEEENGGEFYMISRGLVKYDDDDYTAIDLTAVSREAVDCVHGTMATGEWEGYSLDMLLRPTILLRDFAQHSISLQLR